MHPTTSHIEQLALEHSRTSWDCAERKQPLTSDLHGRHTSMGTTVFVSEYGSVELRTICPYNLNLFGKKMNAVVNLQSSWMGYDWLQGTGRQSGGRVIPVVDLCRVFDVLVSVLWATFRYHVHKVTSQTSQTLMTFNQFRNQTQSWNEREISTIDIVPPWKQYERATDSEEAADNISKGLKYVSGFPVLTKSITAGL